MSVGETGVLVTITDQAQALEAGQWSRINAQNTFQDVALTRAEHDAIVDSLGGANFWGNMGPNAVFEAWNSAAYDESGNRMFFMGGGHADYGGNEVYSFDFDTLEWTRLSDPDPLTEPDGTGSRGGTVFVPEDGPLAPHTYDGLVWNPVTETLWLTNTGVGFASDLGNPHSPSDPAVWEFDPATGEWEEHSAAFPFGRGSSLFLEDTGQVLALNNSNRGTAKPRLIDADGGETHGTVRDLDKFGVLSGRIDAVLFENPETGQLYQIRKEGISQIVTIKDTDGNIVDFQSDQIEGAPENLHQAGVDYNPDDGNFYIWNGGREVIRWDPGDEGDLSDDTFETLFNIGGDAPGGKGGGRIFDKFVYLEEADVFAGTQNGRSDEGGGLWLYKPGDNPESIYKLDVGAASLDPATATAINLHVEGGDFDVNANGAISVAYRAAGTDAWQEGLDLLQLPNGDFAGSVIGLTPDTAYEIKLTPSDPDGLADGVAAEQVLTARTADIPAAVDSGGGEIRVSSLAELQAAVDQAQGGEVIVLEAGVHRGAIDIKSNGTADAPITIRGAADGDSVIDGQGAGAAIRLEGDHVHIEGLTLRNADKGIALRDGTGDHVDGAVIRGNTITEVRRGIDANEGHRDLTIVDNLVLGTNVFGDTSSDTWGDEGIVVTGQGIVVANNTLAGFGDSLGLNKNTDLANRGIEFHHNQVLWGGDDGIEFDFSDRNVVAHHNLLMNTANGLSFQFVDDGPAIAYRNVIVNAERGPFKIKPEASTNHGIKLFNNTTVKQGEPWKDFSGGPNEVQILNNLFVGDGTTADTVRADTTNFRNLEMDHNAWSHDGKFQVGGVGVFSNFADWQGGPQGDHDVLLEGQEIFASVPLDDAVQPFDTFRTPAEGDLRLAAGSDAIDAGTLIPGVTDSFTGAGPDIGALESGQPLPEYGSRVHGELGPIVQDDSFRINEPKSIDIDVVANDLSVSGERVTVVEASAPNAGSAEITDDGSIRYTPETGFEGDVTFTYTVQDESGRTSVGTVDGRVFDEPLGTIPEVALILRADKLGEGVAGNGAVSAWDDRSGQGNAARQAGDGRQPALVEVDGKAAVRFDGVDDVLRIDNSASLNMGGPYEAKTLTLAFRPGEDVDSRQVIYEQGGALRGINIYLEDGKVHASAWNLAEEVWGPLTLSGAVAAGEVHTITLSLDAAAGTLSAHLDGQSLGSLSGAGLLYDHGNPIGLGAMVEETVFGEEEVRSGDIDFHFDGEVLGAGFYNQVLSETDRARVESEVATPGGMPVVVDPNQTPAVEDDSATTEEGNAVTIDVLANDSDPDGDSLAVSEVTDAGHGSVSVSADGTITYTPDSGFAGNDSFTYTVTDGRGGEASGRVELTVATAEAPDASEPSGPTQDQPSDGDDSATASDPVLRLDTSALLETVGTGGSVALWDDASVAGNDAAQTTTDRQPTLVEVDGVAGVRFDGVDDVLRVENSESLNVGGPYAEKTLTIAFRPGADVDSRQVVYEQGGHLRGLNVYIEDGEVHASAWNLNEGSWGPLTLSGQISPGAAHTITLRLDAGAGTFSANLDGHSLGILEAAGQLHDHIGPIAFGAMARDSLFEDGPVQIAGTDFHFEGDVLGAEFHNRALTDAERAEVEAGIATSLEVDPNEAPVADDDSATTEEGNAVTIDVLANDSDPDGDSLAVSEVTDAGHGSVSVNADGTIIYTPDSGFAGDDSFTYTVSDGNGGQASGSVAVTVAAKLANPVLDLDGMALVDSLGVGDPVSLWDDATTAFNDAHQSDADRQPTLVEVDGVAGVRFDGVDDVLRVDNSETLNTGGSFAEKTLSIAFRPGADVDSRQVVYEQGGHLRGLNVYIEDGEVHASAWNLNEGSWGPLTLTGQVSPGEVHTITLSLDAEAGVFAAALDGQSLGQLEGAGELHDHIGPIAFGAMARDSMFQDEAIHMDGSDFHFQGDVLGAEFFNAPSNTILSELDILI